MIDGKQIKSSSIDHTKVNFSGASSGSDPAVRSWVQSLVDASVYNRDLKDSVRAATTSNITLSGVQTIDGVSLIAGDRILVKNQTTASANGIYVVGSGAWVRSTDADSSSEVTSMMLVPVEEGTSNGGKTYKLDTTGTITLGTTALSYSLFSSTYYATPTASNKGMTATATTTDFDQACATGLVAAPAQGSYVRVFVNGIAAIVGDGVRTKECYFGIGTSGTTARALNALQSGDRLFWVGSVAGYQLTATDIIDFDYNV